MNQILCFVAAILIGTVNSQVGVPMLLKSCDDNSILETYFGGCVDSEGCRMPLCCTAVSSTGVNFTMFYPAKVDAQSGVVTLSIVGNLLATSADDPLLIINTPLVIPVPKIIAATQSDMCYVGPDQPYNPGFCPQTAGNVYKFNQILKLPFPLTTTAGLVAVFQLAITSGTNTLVCARGYGRFIAPALGGILG